MLSAIDDQLSALGFQRKYFTVGAEGGLFDRLLTVSTNAAQESRTL